MRNLRNTPVVFALLLLFASIPMAPMATAGNNPVDEKWWPSKFGTEDKLGAVQHITPEKRIATVRLVKGVDDWKDGNYFRNGHRLEDV